MNTQAVNTRLTLLKPERATKPIDRRATSLLPMTSTGERFLALDPHACKRQMQAIEARKYSGYLHLQAEQKKSRAAVLLFRGRVLACVYGNKDIPGQLFAEAAYSNTVRDFVDPENALSLCHLDEELVVAAASLFHGAVLQVQSQFGSSAAEHFNGFHGVITRANMPGCIVLSTDDGTPAGMVYLFAGKIVGFFLYNEGWQRGNWREVLSFIDKSEGIKVRACMLPVTNLDGAEKFTFSLSGLADSEVDSLLTCNLVTAYKLKKIDLKLKPVIEADRFIPLRARTMNKQFTASGINHAYDIDP